MHILNTLTRKFIFIGTILLLFITVFVYATFVFTSRIGDEATRINMAGKLRFRSLVFLPPFSSLWSSL